MINYEDMKYKHRDDCHSKDSNNIEEYNKLLADIDGDIILVEYDCYCAECGNFLYNFSWGHYEMY